MKVKTLFGDVVRFVRYNTVIRDEWWINEEAKATKIKQKDIKEKYDTNIPDLRMGSAAMSYKKDKVIEKILDEKKYSFMRPLFIRNPYWNSPLTGLLIFNTNNKCKVRYTVKGKEGMDDFTACDEAYGTRHRTPVVALYADYTNIIDVELLDASDNILGKRTIKIVTDKLPADKVDLIDKLNGKDKAGYNFLYVTGGKAGSYVIDRYGEIRHYFKKVSQPYGAFVLDDGRVLFPERHMRRPNRGNNHSVIAHEMDMLGRTFKTYKHEKGYHHWGTVERRTGNILVTTSSMSDGYMENVVDEIDRETGKVLRSISANELFDDTYVTRYDWAHINAIEYMEKDDALLMCMRNIHTVAKADMKTKKLKWIIANPEFYKETEQADKVLKPVGNVEWFFQQHGAKILYDNGNGILRIAIFDNHVINRRPVEYFDGKKESYVCIYEVNENDFTVKMIKRYTAPLTITRSNAFRTDDGRRMVAGCANIVPPKDGYSARVIEYDYDSGKKIRDLGLKKDFFAIHPMEFCVSEMAKPMGEKGGELVIGKLYGPERADKLPEEFKTAEIFPEPLLLQEDKTGKSKYFKFVIFADMLQLYAQDHDVEKIWVYNDKDVLVQDFTDSVQTMDVFKQQFYYVSMDLKDLRKGKYKIALQYKGKNYRTDKWIKVK